MATHSNGQDIILCTCGYDVLLLSSFFFSRLWCQNGDILRHVFSASRVQHISDMHSKFALRPHDVRKYGRHPISDRWD